MSRPTEASDAGPARPGEPAPPSGGGTAVTVAARLDRLPITRTHRLITVTIGIGMFFDIYEVFLTSAVSGALTSEFHLTSAVLAPVLASTFVGMFIGSIVLGRMADRVGRRRAFMINLALYSLASLAGAFSPNAVWLMISRFVAGLGVGAELPLADAYLSDMLPARQRGRYTAWAYTISFIAVPIVGFLARGSVGHLAGIAGWRWIFALGALGSAIVFLLRTTLPESPRWLEAVGRGPEADRITSRIEAEALRGGHRLTEPTRRDPEAPVRPARAGVRVLLTPPLRRRTLMMAVFQVFQVFGYYGFGTLVPLILAAKGYALSTSLLFTALTFLGYPVGSLLSLPLVERFERKYLVVGSVVAMAAFGLAFGFSNSMVPIVIFGFLYTAASNVFANGYHIYQAEIFPTAVRSTAASGTYAISRLATGAMPFILLPILAAVGAGWVFVIICGALVVVALDIGLIGPRTTGLSTEDVVVA
ncbi:MFS transporter [Pseudonocardia xinjiangensis]|uniref:MFS transporter n=1 Tax=Pseudonocardia xinjiangensis TaxID=75289 RepID=UPI003D8C4AEC